MSDAGPRAKGSDRAGWTGDGRLTGPSVDWIVEVSSRVQIAVEVRADPGRAMYGAGRVDPGQPVPWNRCVQMALFWYLSGA